MMTKLLEMILPMAIVGIQKYIFLFLLIIKISSPNKDLFLRVICVSFMLFVVYRHNIGILKTSASPHNKNIFGIYLKTFKPQRNCSLPGRRCGPTAPTLANLLPITIKQYIAATGWDFSPKCGTNKEKCHIIPKTPFYIHSRGHT